MSYPIPDAALDSRLAIVGRTGSGKSTTAKGGVERLLHLGRRVCIVDMLDGWWGLRLKRDGTTPAYPVAVIGGRHGDLALSESGGALIGRSVAEAPESTIVCLSELDSDAARRRFAKDFFDALHRFNRAPLHLVIDEADFYAPQQPTKDGPGPLLLNRVKEITSRGRMRGFRVWLVTQRPAKLHKDALSQADTLIAMQLTSTQDRAAIEGWIGDQADRQTGKEILASLPGMKLGQGVLWAPSLGILQVTQFPLPATYDSSRTPDYGETLPDVTLAPLDLPQLRDRLATVEKEAAASDPVKLRAEVRRLTGELAKAQKAAPATDPAALADAHAVGFREGHFAGRQEVALAADRAAADVLIALDGLRAAIKTAHDTGPSSTPVPAKREGHPVAKPAPQQNPKSTPTRQPATPTGDVALTGPQRKLLTVLAQYPEGRTKKQLAILAGYAHNGGAFNNPLANLRSRGLARGGPESIVATEDGLAALGDYEPLPTGGALREYWFANLPGPAAKLLRALCEAYPAGMAKADLARACGYEPTGGAFNNPLARLRSLELATGRGGAEIRASDDLFD